MSGIIWIRIEQSRPNIWHGFVWFYGRRQTNHIWESKEILCSRSFPKVGSTCVWFYYTSKACLAFHETNMNNYHRWAAYVAGAILVLMTELGVRFEDSISMLVPPFLNLCYWYFTLPNNKISYWMPIKFPWVLITLLPMIFTFNSVLDGRILPPLVQCWNNFTGL